MEIASPFSNDRRAQIYALLALLLVALVANHLIAPQYFPFNPDYEFPWFGFFFTLIGGLIIFAIAEICFRKFRQRFFEKQVTSANILAFLFSVLGLVTLVYIPAYFLSSWLMQSGGGLQYLLSGLFVSLLLAVLALAVVYAKPLYLLHRSGTVAARLKVRSGKVTEYVYFEDIAYFLSLEKVVYLVRQNGNKIVTDFRLNMLEEQLSQEMFFRANRQLIVQREGIDRLKPEKNGKLILRLVYPFNNENEWVVSRYKAKALKDWLNTNS